MRLSRILIVLPVCVAASPAAAVAQRPESSGGRIAGLTPALAPMRLEPARPRRRPMFFGNVPVVAASDGRVFANFGRGFEQVVHQCGVEVIFGGWTTQDLIQPAVVQPTVLQPSADLIQPLPYMPPAPLQPPASESEQIWPQAMQQAQATGSTLVNTQMCWSNDPRGRVFVGLP